MQPTGRRPATWLLCALNLGIHALTIAFGALSDGGGTPVEDLVEAFGNDPAAVWQGEWWRLLTSAFLHANILHVAMNAYGLWVLGYLLETVLGPVRLIVLYVGAAIVGSAASVVWSGEVSVGASGALFGFAGALLSLTFLARDKASAREMMGRLVWVIGLNLGAGIAVNKLNTAVMIDNYAHLGGLVGGMLLGMGMAAARAHGPLSAWSVGGTALFGLVAAAALGAATHPRENARFEAARAELALKQGNADEAKEMLERALRLDRHEATALMAGYRICSAQLDGACARRHLGDLLALEPLPLSGKSSVDEGRLLRLLFKEGRKAIAKNDWELAAVLFGRASFLDPGEETYANDHAWSLLQSRMVTPEDRAVALAQADRARRLTHGNAAAINHTYAEALHQSGRTDEAVEILEDMVRRLDADWWFRVKSAAGEIDEAMLKSEIARMRGGAKKP